MKTQGNKIILDCTIIKNGYQFPLILDSGDLDSDEKFFKVYDAQRPKSCGAKVQRIDFKLCRVIKNISGLDDAYNLLATEDQKVYIASEPGFVCVDEESNLEFYVLEG